MKSPSRALAALTLAGGLALGALPASAVETPVPSRAQEAKTPKVAYAKTKKKCYSATMDGQPYKQCQAVLTVKVTKIHKGFTISLVMRDHSMNSLVGTFTSKGSRATKRFKSVISYGGPGDMARPRYRVIVKDSEGTTILKTKRRTFR